MLIKDEAGRRMAVCWNAHVLPNLLPEKLGVQGLGGQGRFQELQVRTPTLGSSTKH